MQEFKKKSTHDSFLKITFKKNLGSCILSREVYWKIKEFKCLIKAQ